MHFKDVLPSRPLPVTRLSNRNVTSQRRTSSRQCPDSEWLEIHMQTFRLGVLHKPKEAHVGCKCIVESKGRGKSILLQSFGSANIIVDFQDRQTSAVTRTEQNTDMHGLACTQRLLLSLKCSGSQQNKLRRGPTPNPLSIIATSTQDPDMDSGG